MGTIFKDSKGESWDCDINVGAIKRTKANTGIDFSALTKEHISDLYSDPVALVDVLYSVLFTQLKEKDITEEDFAERMGGDAVYDATHAMLEGLVNFTHSPVRKKILSDGIALAKKMEDYTDKRLEEITSKRDFETEIKKRIDAEMEKA